MGASLIGKALDFGPSEYGFESHAPSRLVSSSTYSYFLAHVNLAIKKKHAQTTVRYSKHAHQLLRLLYQSGCVNNYIIHWGVFRFKPRKFITFSITHYKNTPFFGNVRVVTTPSRQHSISLKTLTIINTSFKSSIMILSSPQGILTHKEAIRRKVSGQILAIMG